MKPKLLVAFPFVLLVPSLAAEESVPLSTLDLSLAESGWGETKADRSIDGNPLRIGGKTFEHGVGTHANGSMRLRLDGKASRFTAMVGVDDEVDGKAASIVFEVRGDGRTLWSSEVLGSDDAAVPVDLDIIGVSTLQLICNGGGDGVMFDHADWAEATITYSGKPPVMTDSSIVLAMADSAMVLRVQGDKLSRAYFGPKLAEPGDAAFARADAGLVYPTQWDYSGGENAVAVIQPDGRISLDLRYRSHREKMIDDNRSEWTVTLADPVYPVEVDLHFLVSKNENVVEQWSVIRNAGDNEITIEHAESGFFQWMADRYFLSTFTGTWGAEALLHEEEIVNGIKEVRSVAGTRTTQPGQPAFVLSLDGPAEEENGEVILGALAWSGNWRLRFEVNAYHSLTARIGYDPYLSRYKLAKGGTMETPRLIVTHSNAGKGPATRNLHRWARKYGIRGGDEPRRILLNSWEGAYFTFDDELIKRMISDAAKTGIELFVLDDGWFGMKHPRDGADAGLGDWMVNTHKLKDGVQGLIDHAEKEGIDFGIWVEPEMVNPKSELYENHPDWVIELPDREKREQRNQLGLDLSNPAVRDYIVGVLDTLLSDHPGISYIKWDCNRNISDPGSNHLASDRQEHLSIDYTRGYYDVLRRITEKHPAVTFQACGSGGGRNDYGNMRFHHEFWTSDNTDALERIKMQWSINHIFPAIATAAHVTEVPNHQTGRVTPIKFRFDVAMTGRLGFELRPERVPAEDMAFSRKALDVYKTIRPVVQFGDLHRLRSPFKNDVASLMYVHEDDGEQRAVFFAFLMEQHIADARGPIQLHGLDPAKRYRLKEINLADPAKPMTRYHDKELGGDFLMTQGLDIPWNSRGDYQSCVIEIVEAD
ncbi:MAG: alpha-galactosidase [Akkermansiaceae bacterium]|nr:alpha-galactosidase [Akkermansiaceae bacterium]MCP5547856.1 alpha-galactosidase [Akkermansiaceae bacterium]